MSHSLAVAWILALAGAAAPVDPGQRRQPSRVQAGGLLKVEPLYFDMAAKTGGNFYFWAPGEFAGAGLQLPLPSEPVLLAYGRFETSRRSFAFPVEAGARTLTIFAGAQRKDRAVLVRPGGAVVAAGEEGATLQTFSHMTLATIRKPEAGTWRIDFDGAGLYSVSAHVKPMAQPEGPAIVAFDFVEMRGRPGHEGWFPIEREVFSGQTIACRLNVAGAASGVQLELVTGDDRPIAKVPLESEAGDTQHFMGRCAIPKRPFRVAVSGRDRLDRPFRRVEPALYTPR